MLNAPAMALGTGLTAAHMLATLKISLNDPKEIRVRHAALLAMHTVACPVDSQRETDVERGRYRLV